MLAEHAKRMIRMAGEDAVALGTEFDGLKEKICRKSWKEQRG